MVRAHVLTHSLAHVLGFALAVCDWLVALRVCILYMYYMYCPRTLFRTCEYPGADAGANDMVTLVDTNTYSRKLAYLYRVTYPTIHDIGPGRVIFECEKTTAVEFAPDGYRVDNGPLLKYSLGSVMPADLRLHAGAEADRCVRGACATILEDHAGEYCDNNETDDEKDD